MPNSVTSLQNEIAQLIVDTLNLEDISGEDIDRKAPLFGDGLGLDSIDALEIGAVISKKYKIKLKSQNEETRNHFFTLESLTNFVFSQLQEKAQTT